MNESTAGSSTGQPHLPDDPVVLVRDDGTPIGTADRRTVHTAHTPLHLAFSCYLRDARGRVLLTRRALGKTTWPGVWTNAACGHLCPGETAAQAVQRRVPEELGAAPLNLRVVLPDFRYRAVDASGVVENELCPVFVRDVEAEALRVEPSEVVDTAWVAWDDVRRAAAALPRLLSPWCVEQVSALGADPWRAP
ncbi:isopentenyl-diphosphate Delta-isomerase [Nigerium massiliense]|uniref:isopentenyl-diphosphate Delta-isomerase n=1 Tax=Nigerium massiliense TaxID=1522317 RepID=UPI0006938F22|nr:isopentenyl-diphosphate Delta-isomerase [Nigerium massiliense]